MRPRRALRRLILEPALLVSLVDRSTPAQLVLDRTPWWVLRQFAQSHSDALRCATRRVGAVCAACPGRKDRTLQKEVIFLSKLSKYVALSWQYIPKTKQKQTMMKG